MKKPGKRAVTKQLEILDSVEGKGPVDWAVTLVLSTYPNFAELKVLEFDTINEMAAARHTLHWLCGTEALTPTEYLGYAELPDPPHKLKFVLYAGIFAALIGLVGLLVV